VEILPSAKNVMLCYLDIIEGFNHIFPVERVDTGSTYRYVENRVDLAQGGAFLRSSIPYHRHKNSIQYLLRPRALVSNSHRFDVCHR
jgi:hypothetical protein